MLYYVSGTVAVLEPGLAVIDCGGVGYGCRVTAYTAGQLKLNQNARLYITESIREDAFDLYGFISREEQRCFELLTSVNGVGPKAALAILSSGGPQNFTLAVMTGDEKMLTAAQGVGKKLAQRIILELKDKLIKEQGGFEAGSGAAAALHAQNDKAVAAPAAVLAASRAVSALLSALPAAVSASAAFCMAASAVFPALSAVRWAASAASLAA